MGRKCKMKRLLSFTFAIILFCCLVLVACSPNHIHQLRTGAKQELTEYVNPKLQQDFSTENISKINEYLLEGIANINQANDQQSINQALLNAKSKIDEIKQNAPIYDQPIDIVDTNDENYLEFVNDVLVHFVNQLKVEDITKVERFYSYGSMSFAPPVEKTTTTLQSDIEVIYQWLKGLTFVETNDETAEGGSSVLLKIYTSKNVFQISNSAGEDFLWCYGKRYEKHAPIPEITGEYLTYCFSEPETYCYLNIGFKVSKTYEYDFSNVECKKLTNKVIANKSQYRCQTPIGMLYLYDVKYFERNGEVYEIISGIDFSQIFVDYPTQKPFIQDLSTTTILDCKVNISYSFNFNNDEYEYPKLEVINTYQEFLAIYPQGVYDEEFFKTNFLVIVTCFTSNSAVRYSLNGVYQKDNETIIRLICNAGYYAGAQVVGECYVEMEFSKSIKISQSTTNVSILHPITKGTSD